MILAALIHQPLAGAALGLVLGLALGLIHFASLRRVTTLYLSGGSPARAIALQLGRLALLGLGFAGLAWLGALPLLAGAVGVLIAREVILRRVKRGL